MEDLPGWVISPMPGPPPRQHKHERQYTPSTYSVIPTRRIWNDDYDGQMILGELGGLKFPDICLTDEEKPRKNLTQETYPDRESNPGPLRDKRAWYYLLHSGGPTEIVQRLDQVSKSVGSFAIMRGLEWVLGDLTGTISSWAVPQKNTRKRWFLGIKTRNCRPGHFYTLYSWQIFEIFLIHS